MKKRANPDSEQNIRRIDTKPRAKKQTHGFQVHFLRGRETVTRLFSDSGYDGKEGARRAARKFKRAAMSDLPARFMGAHGGLPVEGVAVRSVIGPSQIATPSTRRLVVTAWRLPFEVLKQQSSTTTSPIARPHRSALRRDG